jgi:hypothetical protein
VSDQHRGRNGARDRKRIEPRGVDALEQAARELARAVGKAPARGPAAPDQPVDRSSDSKQADKPRDPRTETVAPRGVPSPDHASLAGRLFGAFHSVSTRTLLILGAIFAIVIIVAVSPLSPIASRKGGHDDVVAQGCDVHESAAQATVVVTNHGDGTMSYLFDVVFSQNQSEVEGIPAHVTALPAGKSETFRVYAGSLDTSRAFTCTIANLERLAG